MGLLSGIMSSPTYLLERRLESIYVPLYQCVMGMSRPEAKANFDQELAWAKGEVARGGDFVVPERFGSHLIANRHKDPKIGAFLARIGAEGVRDKDVIWFWGMHNLDRVLMMRTFALHVGACILSGLRQGMTQEQAHTQARQIHPLYGNPEDTSVARGENRPIPVELKDRVDIYIEKRAKENFDHYRADMEGASSFNALVRRELRSGRL